MSIYWLSCSQLCSWGTVVRSRNHEEVSQDHFRTFFAIEPTGNRTACPCFTSRGNHGILSKKEPLWAVDLRLWLGGNGADTGDTTSAQHCFTNPWIIHLLWNWGPSFFLIIVWDFWCHQGGWGFIKGCYPGWVRKSVLSAKWVIAHTTCSHLGKAML